MVHRSGELTCVVLMVQQGLSASFLLLGSLDFEPACQLSKRATPSVAQGDDSPSSFLLEAGVATQVGSHVCSKAHTHLTDLRRR